MGRAPDGRVPVSIVCVFNDVDVLETCLKASVAAGLAAAPETEFIGVDNRGGAFPTAGAALNHGASTAKNEVVVFVHQDVVLHDLPALEAVAAVVRDDPAIGVLGSVGVSRSGRPIGRMRDRVVPLGDPATRPTDIESLDEVLFMTTRERVIADPISTDPELAWHAYAVEYAVRMRKRGLRAVAMNIPLTHNSLTTNLARLDFAHQHVGEQFPDLLPIHTTCGTIRAGETAVPRNLRRVSRGVRVWWTESVAAWRAAAAQPDATVVLADIRLLIDEAADLAGATAIHARDIADGAAPRTAADGLTRLGRSFDARTTSIAEADKDISGLPDNELLLVTNLTVAGLRELSLRGRPHVVGVWNDVGLWALVGASAAQLGGLWPARRNRPFGGIVPLPSRASRRTPGTAPTA